MTEFIGAEREALDLLPYPLASAVIKTAAQNRLHIHEIRLRLGQYLSITSNGRNYKSYIRCKEEDIEVVVRRLCGNSLYSHADTLREGYISYGHGIRAGVCGRAVCRGGGIDAVTDITSVNIRIPHRIKGAGDTAYEILRGRDFSCGMLIYSPPGVGKTTVLRELALKLATGERAHRVAVIDSRSELMTGVGEVGMTDVLTSYPRGRGIEIAVRTLSPQFVVCDEISSDEDAAAVMSAVGCGVNIIATAHALSFADLLKRGALRDMYGKGVFSVYLGLLCREGNFYRTEVSFSDDFSDAVSEVDVI